MTRTDVSGPGRILLRVARVIFHAQARDTAVHPTIADLRQEWREARTTRERLAARWRGYVAFWALALHAPFAFPRDPASLPHAGFLDTSSRVAAWAIGVASVVSWWAAAGPWALALIPGSGLVAVGVHAWHARHPSSQRAHGHDPRHPQINISGIHVGGDAGGAIFAAGSVAIVLLGIPLARWFVPGMALGATVLAWALARRHATARSVPLSVVTR